MNKFKNGFTIVEVLVALVVGMIVMAAVYAMVNLGQGTSGGVSRRVLTQQDARAVLDLMAMEISMASYNPTNPKDTSTWTGAMGGSCPGSYVWKPLWRGFYFASADLIGVGMDLNLSKKVPDANNEYIMYYHYPSTRALLRYTNCGGEYILGGTATGVSTMVRNSETSPVTPMFQYFDGAGNVITTVNDTTARNIKRIRINIVADDPVGDTKGGIYKVSRRTYSTDVLVRNHAMAY